MVQRRDHIETIAGDRDQRDGPPMLFIADWTLRFGFGEYGDIGLAASSAR